MYHNSRLKGLSELFINMKIISKLKAIILGKPHIAYVYIFQGKNERHSYKSLLIYLKVDFVNLTVH